MTIRSTQAMIAHYRLAANKKLGQHFLTDPLLLTEIVRHARIRPEHHVVEIGPGPGGLTRALLDTPASSIHACELDKRCVEALGELSAHDTRLRVIEGDALILRPDELAPDAPRILVANLPYNVGTAIVAHWLQYLAVTPGGWDAMTVMLQKEVVQRMAAAPGSRHYGRLSILCQWLCDVADVMDVSPEYFSPPPKVMSAVVRLVPKPVPAFEASFSALERLLHAMFSQRRKMLRRSLATLHDAPLAWLERAAIDPTRRPETLSLPEIGALLKTGAIND